MLNLLTRLLKVLNSETESWQISLAFCFALIAGLTPLLSLHNAAVLLFVLVLRVNLSSFITGLIFFSGIAYIGDPLFHVIGLAVLKAAPLQDTWTIMYNNLFWLLTGFNNTVVMGSLIFSLLLFIPSFFLFNYLVKKYRETLLELVRKSRIMKFLKASKFYRIYAGLSGGAQ